MAAGKPSGPERRWIEQALNAFAHWAPLGANGIQCPPIVIHGKAAAVVSLFPKTPRTIQHAVKTHSK